MKMTLRWYGENDPVTLEKIRQIPGVQGIVSAIYEIPVGEVWPYEAIMDLKGRIEAAGLTLEAIESVPVHEEIKLGLSGRDHYIDNYCQTLRNLGKAEVEVVCYNFMPVFDWTRTDLAAPLPDGSNSLKFDAEEVARMDPLRGNLKLPGWDLSYREEELHDLLWQYQDVTEEDLWDHLRYFLEGVIPIAEEAGVKMAIHPDDPPWPIFGLPRIIRNRKSLERLISLVDSPNNGITLCSGSLGADPENDIPAMIRTFGGLGRIHFGHVRNIRILGPHSFQETSHRSADGSLDMVEIMKAYSEIGFTGPIRPDHGRMIWGEQGRAGYGLFDRALGATYLNGIWETLEKTVERDRNV